MNFVTRAQLFQDLSKALEAGQYDAAPSTLVQGGALQIEHISPVLYNVGFQDRDMVLTTLLSEKPVKATLVQFDRQLSYGHFGGSAQLEGAVGQEDTGDFVRVTTPMAYYSQMRKSTIVADAVDTVDGVSATDRQSEGAAKVIAGDLEFDSFRGMDDFSNGGVFDGNPFAMADLPNMRGMFLQVRQSDSVNSPSSHDLMFDEYGSDESIDIPLNDFLNQDVIENAKMRAGLNFSQASQLITDPRCLSQYNKISYSISRVILGNSPQDATGSDLNKQWTSGGPTNIKPSRFLSGKTIPGRPRPNGPNFPTALAAADSAVAATPTPFVAGEVYQYYVTAGNEIGESTKSPTASVTIAASRNIVTLTITAPAGTVRYFNVYRTIANGSKPRFIGRVKNSGGATTTFIDLGNRLPGFVTSILLDDESAEYAELKPYSRLKLGIHELAKPEAFFAFRTLKVMQPRKNVLISNCDGQYIQN